MLEISQALDGFTVEEFFKRLPDRERNDSDRSFKPYVGEFGNFSIAVLVAKSGVYAGIAKRNPCDRHSDAGLQIAIVRAWRSYQGKRPGYCRQRPITDKQAKRIAAETLADSIIARAIVDAAAGDGD